MKKSLIIILFVVITFLGCHNFEKELVMNSYKDIPNITQSEIEAIEKFKNIHIKYGYIETTDLYYDENYQLVGFMIDVLELFSTFFNLNIETIYYDDFKTLINDFNNKKIDFIDFYSRYDSDIEIFQTIPITNRSLCINTLPNENNFKNVEEVNGLKIGFLKGTKIASTILSIYEEIDFEVIEIVDEFDLKEALENRLIDAFVCEEVVLPMLQKKFNFDSVPFFDQAPTYSSFVTTNKCLREVISAIDKYLIAGGIEEVHKIREEVSLVSDKFRFNESLTLEEKNYLTELQKQPIPIGYIFDTYPISFYNENSKMYDGISGDILDRISLITGLNFEIHHKKLTIEQLLASLNNGEIKMISQLIHSESRDELFLFTENPYHQTKPALISLNTMDNLELYQVYYKKVGIVTGSAFQSIFDNLIPNHQFIVEFSNSNDAFLALEKQQIDLVMLSEDMLLSQTNLNEKTNFKINITLDKDINSYFGFNKGEVLLASIIDKSLKYVDTYAISNKWVFHLFDYSSKAAQIQSLYIWFFSVIIFIITTMILTLILANEKLRKKLSDRTTVLMTTYEFVPDHIFTKDINRLYTSCNAAFEKQAGFKEEYIIGKKYEDVYTNSTIAKTMLLRSYEDKVFLENKHHVSEDEITLPNGEKRILEIIRSPLIQDNKVVGLLGVGRDITNRKQIENESRYAAESKSLFLANMSHEIRTPLNAIIGFSELALDTNISIDSKDDYFKKIKVSGEWLLQIINDILDVSKIESGKIELEQIPFDLLEVFKKCQTIILPKAIEKGLTLYCDTENLEDTKVIGDPLRLRQVLLNLLTNAVKFTEKGIVKLISSITKMNSDYVTINFCVSDSGVGIHEDKFSHLFDPFMQADASTTRKYGGTGLGLTISKNIINLMGGVLTVESVVGEGSKFSFTLEFKKAKEIKVIEKFIEKPQFVGTVLVCEDNEVNQLVMANHLKRIGLDIIIAENGLEAINIIKNRQEIFDLIFMDIQMPLMDGIEATKILREMNYPSKIIALTANVLKSDLELYQASGIDGHLGKPFTSNELWACLIKYIKPISVETSSEYASIDTQEKYLKLASVFVNHNKNSLRNIKDAISKDKFKYAYRLIHTIRGDAVLLEKHELADASRIIEFHLKDSSLNFSSDEFETFEKELQKVLDEYSHLIEDRIQILHNVDINKIMALLDKVHELLINDDIRANQYIPKLEKLPKSDDLIRFIEEYEYETAIETLVLLKEELLKDISEDE